jgi:hypothetical protein
MRLSRRAARPGLVWIGRSERRAEMIVQLWGPVFDLVGDGGFKAFTFSWFTLKYGNVIEMILVVLIFVVGMFINLPSRKAETGRHER